MGILIFTGRLALRLLFFVSIFIVRIVNFFFRGLFGFYIFKDKGDKGRRERKIKEEGKV